MAGGINPAAPTRLVLATDAELLAALERLQAAAGLRTTSEAALLILRNALGN